ncbi:MAG TPA: polymer-forming cytoskeletal protein [Kofleriaceae bacterium]|nr:polymer-forming cytoskeletal protein [Kofleriaceae bacterium]
MTQPARRESMVGEINTLLGRGSEFEGKLTFEGTVRIDGTLRGEVFSDDVLIVGEGARVEAEVDVGEIIVQGAVMGNIRAKRSIELLTPGRVKGDLTTPSLQIDKGVIFEGRCFMEGVAERMSAGSNAGTSMATARKQQAEIIMESPAPPPPPKGQVQAVASAPPPKAPAAK